MNGTLAAMKGPRIRGRGAWVLVLLVLLLGRIGVAHASPKSVLILTAETPEATGALDRQVQSALNGQLRELGIDVAAGPTWPSSGTSSRRPDLEAVAASRNAFAVTWLEQEGQMVRIYLYDAVGHHLYVREAVTSGSTASLAEEVAVVLRSAIGALGEGDAVAMTEVQLKPVPPSSPPTVPVPEPREDAGAHFLRLRAGYSGTLFVRGQPIHHGVALGIAAHIPQTAFFAGAGYTYFPFLELASPKLRLDLIRHPVELFLGAETPLGKVHLAVEGALIADAVTRQTTWTSDALVATDASTRWLWAVSSRLAVAIPVSAQLRLRVGAAAEFVLNRYSQAIAEADGRNDIAAELLLARPRLDAGAEVLF